MERRGDDPGRREDDRRWLKIQQEIMNLTTTARADQQAIANLEIQLTRLEEHVEEVDEYMRGVAGKESVEVRLSLGEKQLHIHEVLLQRISDQFTEIHKFLEASLQQIREDLSSIKIQRGIAQGTAEIKEKEESTKFERFREWLKFWGPIILCTIGLVVPLTKTVLDNWEKIAPIFRRQPMNADTLQKEIEENKNGPAGKRVQKKLDEIDKERKKIGLR